MQRFIVRASLGVYKPPLRCWLQFRHGLVIMQQKKAWSERLNRALDGRQHSFLFNQLSVTLTCGLTMSGKFHCHLCAEFFDNGSDLQKHMTSVHGQVSQKAQCPKCDRAYSRKDNLEAHIESVHREIASKFICRPCQKSFSNTSNFKRHLTSPLHSGLEKLQEAKRRRPSASNSSSVTVRWLFAA